MGQTGPEDSLERNKVEGSLKKTDNSGLIFIEQSQQFDEISLEGSDKGKSNKQNRKGKEIANIFNVFILTIYTLIMRLKVDVSFQRRPPQI